MAGEFGQFKPAERQLSDVTAVQPPVQDTSSATALSSAAQGLGQLGQGLMTAFASYEQGQEEAKVMAEQKALSQQKDAFSKELLRARDMADQHGASSMGFKTFISMAYDDSPLDPDIKNKMLKDFQATILGKSFTELSPEEEAFNEVRKQAGVAGYYLEGATEQEIDEATLNYSKAKRQAEADNAEIRSINLQMAKMGQTNAEIDLARKQLGRKQISAVSNLAANHRHVVKNDVADVAARIQRGEIDSKTAKQELAMKKSDMKAIISQISTEVRDRATVDALAKPLLEVFDFAIENVDSKNLADDLQDKIDMMVAKTQFNQLDQNPDLLQGVALSGLVNHSSPSLIASMEPVTAKLITEGMKEAAKPQDITDDTEANRVYLDLVSNSINDRNLIGPDNALVIPPHELLNNVDMIIRSSERFINADDTPSINRPLIQWLAKPEVGMYVKENLSKLSPQSRAKLNQTLEKNAVNFVYPTVQGKVGSVFVDEKKWRIGTSKQSKVANGALESEVEMTQQGNAVVFTAHPQDPKDKTPQTAADSFNNDVAAALTTYFNAIANVSEQSFSEVFERERATLWPSKYGEPTEDGTYVDDKTGEQFEVRDGKRVE